MYYLHKVIKFDLKKFSLFIKSTETKMNNHDDDRLSIVSTMYEKTGDDTTILDSSTVPTYEEFSRKKLNKNLFTKLKNLNSTQYNELSSLMTDDESDEDDKPQPIFRRPLISTENVLSNQERITPNVNLRKVTQIKVEKTEYEYIEVAHKQIQTSFTNYDSVIEMSNENLNLYLSKSELSNKNDESEEELTNNDVISETVIESPQELTSKIVDDENLNRISNFITTPLRLTQSTSICPKSFVKRAEITSPKLTRLSESPNIVTTYEKMKINEKNVVVINHQLDKKNKKRVSMCIEDLPQDIVEHNLDEDENRLDVTRGNIVTLESIDENEKGIEKKIHFKFYSFILIEFRK